MIKYIKYASVALLLAPASLSAQRGDVALVYRLLLDEQMALEPASGAGRPAVLGDRLGHNDVVWTSPNTRAAIRFTSDGSLLRLNPNSRLTIQAEGERNAIVTTLDLEFGELWTKVTKREGQQFNIRTPSGVAAVKGTEFIARVDENGVTTILTLEGIVEFFNDAGRAEVTAGRRMTVTSVNDAPQAQPATSAEITQVADLVQDDAAATAADEKAVIEIPVQDADGRTRVIILEVPRAALRTVLGGR